MHTSELQVRVAMALLFGGRRDKVDNLKGARGRQPHRRRRGHWVRQRHCQLPEAAAGHC